MSQVTPVQIQKFLKGVDYPASKETLLQNAKNLGADENVYASLEQLPDEDFETPTDVSHALGQLSDSADQSSSSQGHDEFLSVAMQDSLAEVQLCEMALQKTSNEDIKKFAQRMIDDHSKMGQQLESLASTRKLAVPQDLDSEDQSTMREMDRLAGKEFDIRFIDHNIEDHEKDIKIFKHYAQQEDDEELKALAEQGVKTLTQHLKMAKDVKKRLEH